MMKLMTQIARCNEIEIARQCPKHPCHKIVSFQSENTFQLPEPWNGNIHSAEILFLASNPSYDAFEKPYPNNDWDDASIANFFENRFSQEHYKRIRYWALIKKYASWILGVPRDDFSLPDKVCITEIVHCKSTRERGVKTACKKCSQKYLSHIINEFHGNYIVVLGRVAEKLFPQDIKDKRILYMAHPNARGITDKDRQKSLGRQGIKVKICDNTRREI